MDTELVGSKRQRIELGKSTDFLNSFDLPWGSMENFDIGLMNLRCARGLPHAEDVDESKCPDWLDVAAKQVEFQLNRQAIRHF